MRLGFQLALGLAAILVACSEPSVPVVVPDEVEEKSEAEPPPAPAPRVPTMAARIDPKSGALRIEDPAGALLLGIRAAVQSATGATVSAALRRTPQTQSVHEWRVSPGVGGGWTASTDVSTSRSSWRLRLRHLPSEGTVDIAASIIYRQDCYVGQESLVLRFSGASDATVIDRAFRRVRAAHGPLVDAWSPQQVQLRLGDREVTLEAHAQALRIEGEPGTVLQVVLEADHYANHPLRLLRDCVAEYDREERVEHSTRSAWPRKAGDATELEARLHLGAGPGILPLRYPDGRRSALVFTDHADQSDANRLRTLMYGRSDAGPGAPGGFVGHGLGMTKTVFHRSRYRQPLQLSDPEYAAEVSRLVQAGIEVGPHSVGDGPEKREKTAESLPAYEAIGGAPVWIDHQPSTNCEALSNRGALPSDRHYVVDLLKGAGYRYAWAGTDVREPADGINLFEPDRPESRTPVLYTHKVVDPDSRTPLRLFSAVWRLYPPDEFLARYSKARLDKLEADRGLHIAHSYLDAHSGAGRLAGKTLMHRDGDVLVLLPEVEAWLGRLETRQAQGRLWVAGVVAVADHLVAMSRVRVAGVAGRVRLESPQAVKGASFLIPGGVVGIELDGEAVPESKLRVEAEGTVVWLDLAARHRRELTWSAGGGALSK